MSMVFLLFLSGIFGESQANTQPPCGAPSAPSARVMLPCLVEHLIQRSFPELRQAWALGRIRFSSFDYPGYFLRVRIDSGTFNSKARNYRIELNPHLFDSPPSIGALEGILAHELVHLTHLENASIFGLAQTGLELVVCPNHRERSVDLEAFRRGYALGIRDFRVWMFDQLSPRQLKTKQRRYFTPAEIDAWIQASGR